MLKSKLAEINIGINDFSFSFSFNVNVIGIICIVSLVFLTKFVIFILCTFLHKLLSKLGYDLCKYDLTIGSGPILQETFQNPKLYKLCVNFKLLSPNLSNSSLTRLFIKIVGS